MECDTKLSGEDDLPLNVAIPMKKKYTEDDIPLA